MRSSRRAVAPILSVVRVVSLPAAVALATLALAPASAGSERPERRPLDRGAYLIARVKPNAKIALRARPGGKVVARVGRRTQFGSLRVFTVFRREGRWLGVSTPELPNRRLAWVDSRRGLYFSTTAYTLHADLSRKRLELRHRGKVLREIAVGIGSWPSTTPVGRFSVTDKLRGKRYGSYYGCCILAISGTQPNLPRGWVGGNRLAIHGTDRPRTIGKAASAGCLRATALSLRYLIGRVPLGTPVFVRP